jgi:chromosome partitioning protein
MSSEIPKTSASTNASAGFGTIYDLAKGDIDRRTLQRARESYDGFVESIMNQLVEAWS